MNSASSVIVNMTHSKLYRLDVYSSLLILLRMKAGISNSSISSVTALVVLFGVLETKRKLVASSFSLLNRGGV